MLLMMGAVHHEYFKFIAFYRAVIPANVKIW